MNSKWDAVDKYFSGQGVVLTATRDASGRPAGLTAIGNVSSLKITQATSVLEHKESHTGQRGVDKRLTTETKCGLSMVGENFSAANLASVTRGGNTDSVAGTEAAEAAKMYPGKVTPLERIKTTAIVVTMNSVALTKYVDATTPWDYKENQDAGSLMFNDASSVAIDKLGTAVTAISVGATTTLTVASTAGMEVGSVVYLRGFTGADMATLNGVSVTVTEVTSSTQFKFTSPTTAALTITTAAGTRAYWAGQAISVAYSYAAQSKIQALTEGTVELFLRFEGLNTAEDNEPVVIEVFKFSLDPAKELSLISDALQSFTLDGSVLADALQSGSQYYRVIKA